MPIYYKIIGTTSMTFSANNTYGEYKHELTVSEMPNHYHNVILNDDKNEIVREHFDRGTWGRYSEAHREGTAVNTSAVITNSQGGNSSHNNIQPSITVYFWRRTA